jgi:hypothetical protein
MSYTYFLIAKAVNMFLWSSSSADLEFLLVNRIHDSAFYVSPLFKSRSNNGFPVRYVKYKSYFYMNVSMSALGSSC